MLRQLQCIVSFSISSASVYLCSPHVGLLFELRNYHVHYSHFTYPYRGTNLFSSLLHKQTSYGHSKRSAPWWLTSAGWRNHHTTESHTEGTRLYLTPRFSITITTKITVFLLLVFQDTAPATTFQRWEQPPIDTSAHHDDALTALVPHQQVVHQHV